MNKIIGVTVGTTLSASSVANSLKGSVSGTSVSITDVSPLEHEIKVKLSLKEAKENVSYIGSIWDNGYGEFPSSGDYVIASVAEDISTDGGTVYFEDGSSCDCWWGYRIEEYVPSVGEIIRYNEDTGGIHLVTIEEDSSVDDITAVTLTKYGKNLCKGITTNSNVTINDGVVTQITADTASGWIKCVSYKNGTYVGVLGTGTLAVGVQSLVFVKDDTFNQVNYGVGGTQRDTMIRIDVSNLPNGTYTISGNFTNITQGSISWKDMQIEVGDTATEFESFKESVSYTPNADGTVNGVTSLYPATTLLTDNEGVTITAEYNKDLNKAFAEIYQAIATMGAATATIPEEV